MITNICLAKSQLETPDYWVIGIYLILSVGLGLWFVRRGTKDTQAYFAGSGAIPWWVAGTSLLVACFAADTPLWIGEIIYKRGLEGAWLYWAPAIGTAFYIMLIAPLWKRSGIMTDIELIEFRYTGKAASIMRLLNSFFYSVFASIMFMGLQLFSIAIIMETVTGFSKFTCIVVTVVFAGSYSVISGLWGVASSGAMQFLVTYIGSVILAIFAVSYEIGGISALVEGIHNLSSSWPQGAELNILPNSKNVMGLPAMTLLFLFGFRWIEQAGMGQYVAQRLIATKNCRQAVYTAMIWGIGFFAVVPLPWIITVLAAKIRLPEITDGQQAYPSMAMLLPTGLKGVLVASMLAAFMSTYSSLMSWGSSYFINDFYKRFVHKTASERHYVRGGQIFMIFSALVSALIALYADSCLNIILTVLTLMSGYWTVMFVRWVWWRVNAWAEVIGLGASIILSGVSYVLPWTHHWWVPENMEAYMGHRMIFIMVGTLISWLVITLLTAPVKAEALDAFYRKVRPPGFWGPVRRRLNLPPAFSLITILSCWILMMLGIYGPIVGLVKLSLGNIPLGASLTGAGIVAIVIAIKKVNRMYTD